MKFCNYRVYICLSANIEQLEIKLQKRKAEKNKKSEKEKKTYLSRKVPFQSLPFLAPSEFGCGPSVIHSSALLSLCRAGPTLLLPPPASLSSAESAIARATSPTKPDPGNPPDSSRTSPLLFSPFFPRNRAGFC